MEPTIIFDNVSKKFSKGYVSDSLRDAIAAPIKSLFSRNGNLFHRLLRPVRQVRQAKQEKNEFWALQNINFDVKPGEALGIIGPNGSGKSTTLKLLARILRPDKGKIEVKGRIGALIELGAGFHTDLTGRENVFLNASILGMSKGEIEKKYDEIVDFAELRDFMDTPVKWYSSGMHARLGFAVAAHTDPQVLLVDEVLSVGDIGFQQKCEKKIRGFKEKRLSIVFVSHNMSAISAVCDKVLVLNKGKAIFSGSHQEAIDIYTGILRTRPEIQNSKITLIESNINDGNGNRKITFESGERCFVSVSFKATDELENINIGIRIRKKENLEVVFGCHYTALTGGRISLNKGQEIRITFELALNLARGVYSLETVAWDQLRNNPLLVKEIDALIIRDIVKTDGIAFLNPVIADFSIYR